VTKFNNKNCVSIGVKNKSNCDVFFDKVKLKRLENNACNINTFICSIAIQT